MQVNDCLCKRLGTLVGHQQLPPLLEHQHFLNAEGAQNAQRQCDPICF